MGGKYDPYFQAQHVRSSGHTTSTTYIIVLANITRKIPAPGDAVMATAVVAAPDFYAISGLFHKFTARTPTEKISTGESG